MAVVQDDAAAAAVELEPQSAAFVPLEALRACGSRPVRAVPVSAGLRERGVRPAGRLPAVVFHPVRDRVPAIGGLVAGPAEPLPDRGGELLLLGRVAGGEAAPGSDTKFSAERRHFGRKVHADSEAFT